MSANHLDNITIAITLDAAPVPQAEFGSVLLLVPLATNSLNGATFVEYTDYTDAVADESVGYISAATLAAVGVAFAQRPRPTSFLVGSVDLVGLDTYSDALANCENAGAEFYAVCLDSRVAATIAALAVTVEASSRLLVFQSADADWLTTGIPAGFSAIAAYERAIPVYHDTASAWADVAYAVNRTAFDLDRTSPPWNAGLQGVAAYAANLTATQKGFLDANNCNHGLPFGGAAFYVDPGVNIAGRAVYEVVTADWFEARLEAEVARMIANLSAAGEKLPITADGQSRLLAITRSLLERGENAGHFVPGQTEVTALPITTADETAKRLRLSGRAQIAGSARVVSFAFNFGLTALSAA